MHFLRALFFLALLSPWAANAEYKRPFRFAYRDPAAATAPLTIYLQGNDESLYMLKYTCGEDGRHCACDFLDARGRKIGSTGRNGIAFEPSANYFRCQLDANPGEVAAVRLRSARDSWTSPKVPVKTSLTAADILGQSLDMNLLRSVYGYSCLMTFLQKAGTTTTNFDCTDQATACNGDNFCLLQSRLPFYLYQDNFQTNFGDKIPDRLYNDGSTGQVCGLQIQQFQCADQQGTPVKEFGLYGTQTGIWNTAVMLTPAPNQSIEFYGFAAQVSPTTGLCPPGLVKRVFYRVNPVNNAAAPDSNYPANLVASQVGDPATPPANLYINQIPGGHCNGESCTLPNAGVLTVSTQAYSSAGQTVFCVMPASLLP